MSDVNANINISINSQQALGQLRALQNQISDFNRSVIASNATAAASQKALTSQLIAQVGAAKGFSTSITNVESSVSRLDRAISKNKLSLGQYFRYATAASSTFGRGMREHAEIMELAGDRVKRLQTQYVALSQTQNGMTRAMAMRPLQLHNADAAIGIQRQQIFNKLMHDGSTAMVNWGKNTQWAGRQLMVGFTVPLTIFGGVAGKIFMDLEKQIVQFKRVYGDLQTTPVEKAGMVEQVKALGVEFTKYGIAVNDTIALAAKAAATGATGADLIAQTTEATRLATLGQIDYQQALDATISLQTAFGISSKDLAEATDFLNAVENQTVTSLDDITSAIPLVAPVIKGLGGDVKDLAIFMTAMREGGVSANEGANALKSGLASLINPTKAAREQLEKVGINIDTILSTNKGDLRGLVTEFGEALGSLDKFERQQTLAKVFGKYQFARLGALFQNISKDGTQASRVIDLTTESAKELAKLSEGELGQLEEAVGVKFTAAVEKLKVAIAPIGEAFLKIATPIIEFATMLADKFNNLPDGLKSFITWGVAIGGVVIPAVVMIVGLFANFLGQMIKMGNTMRMFMQRVRGGGSALQYLESEELDAMAAAASLEGQTNSLTGALNVQRSAVNNLARAYGAYVAGANAAAGALPQGFASPRGRAPRRMATGGFVGGTGNKDSEPALLMPGEFVVSKKAAQQNADLLSAMNSGNLRRLAQGSPSSMFGGQELILAPHTMLAPGNVSGGFGMDRSFFESGAGFEQSLRASAAASSGVRLTDAVLSEMARDLQPYTEEIVESLRVTAQEMKDAGEDATHISDVFDKARPKVEKTLAKMEQAGGNMAKASRGIRTLAYPTDEEMIAQGERRVPAARRTAAGALKFTQFRSRASSSLKKMRNTYGRMFGSVPQGYTAAHVTPESRKLLGGMVPLKGGMLQEGLTKEVEKAKAYIVKKSAEIRAAMGDPVGDAIDGPRNSPHPSVPKAGREDGAAYEKAFVAEASDTRKKASGAKFNPSGWLTGGTSPYDPKTGGANNQTYAPRTSGQAAYRAAGANVDSKELVDNVKGAGKEAGKFKQKLTGMSGRLGAGMLAMDGLIFGMSMMNNGVGDFAQQIMPAVFGLQGLTMMLPMLTSPLGIAVAALAAVGVTAFLLKKGLDANIEAGMKMADSMTVVSSELEGVAEFFGRKTFASRRKAKKDKELSGLTTKQQTMANDFSQSEVGKTMIEEAKVAMAKSGKGFAGTLATQLSQMVISGAVGKKQAEAMALGISQALGEEEMTADIVGKINAILGPNGEDLTDQPLKIIANIEASMSRDEAYLGDVAENGNWDSSILSSDNFLGLGWAYSGEYDQMISDAVAYSQTYNANTVSLLSSIDDEIARQQEVIDKLKEKKKAAKEANDEEKAGRLQAQIDTSEGNIDRLNEKRKQTADQRRQQGINILMNGPRAESFQASKIGIEEQYGVTGMNEAVTMALQRSGNARTSENQDAADKIEAGLYVDIQLGNVDPIAFTALEKMGDDADQVMTLAMEAYVAGDYEKMNTIMQAYTSMPPSVVTVVKPIVDKMGYEEASSFLSIISMFPPEVATKVAVDVSELPTEDMDRLYESITNLQDLGIDVATIISGEGGVNSILELNDALSGIPKTLKKFGKELNAIDKLQSKDAKIEKTIQVVTKITDEQGVETTPAQIKQQIREVADDSGLSVAEVMSLPADVYTKAILMKIQADSLRAQGQSMINAARYLGQVDAAAGSELASKGAALVSAANAIDSSAAAAVDNAYTPPEKGKGGTTPSGGGGGGGGGDKANPYGDMWKSINEKLKMYTNIVNVFKKLKGQKDKLEKALPQLRYKNSLVSDMRQAGLNEAMIAELLSKGYKDAKKIFEMLKKRNKLNVANRAMLAGNVGSATSDAAREAKLIAARAKATELLKAQGVSEEVIASITENDDIVEFFAKRKNMGSKMWKDYIFWAEKAKEVTDDVTESIDKQQEILDQADSMMDRQFDALERQTEEKFKNMKYDGMTVEAIQNQVQANEDLIRTYQDEVKAKQELISDQQRLNDLDQQKIEGYNRQVEIEQRKAETLQREDEMRSRVADSLSRELELMSRQEQIIRDAYQKRIDALDEVARLNERILQSQQDQLAIGKALSQGDVYAAAEAAAQMQANQVKFASEQTKAGLEQGMENEINGLTSNGMTRDQIEAQIQTIRDQSYQTSLLIRDIEDYIYNLKQTKIVPLEDAIYARNLTIRDLNNEIYLIEEDKIEPLTNQNEAYSRIIEKHERQLALELATLEVAGYTREAWDAKVESLEAQISAAEDLSGPLKNIIGDYQAIAREAANAAAEIIRLNELAGQKVTSNIGTAAASGSATTASGQQVVYGGMGLAFAVPNYAGGMIDRFASGGVAGDGGRDSVTASLTPGEFVIRKSMVDKYGQAMFEKINTGSFTVPRYSSGGSTMAMPEVSKGGSHANINAPVYNSYSVNVSASTNASADDIARTVIAKIKTIESSNIRRVNGY